MSGCIGTSRLVLTLLLAFLIWGELGVGEMGVGEAAVVPPPSGRPDHLSSRGGARPAGNPWQGNDLLAVRTQLPTPSPTPIPAALPIPAPTSPPTPFTGAVAGLRVKPLGVFRVTGYSDSPLNGTSGHGVTKSGQRTHWGVVATDPRVVPLGSRLVIDGMGDTQFKALDTGGGVIGRWVDVWFPSDLDAIRFGVKEREVYLVID